MADTFWMIEEAVGRGFYITHEGSFSDKGAAQAIIDRFPPVMSRRMRPALYQTGRYNGPIRVEAPR